MVKRKVKVQAGLTTKVELGDIVRDAVTGFEGSVESITIWRFGCRRVFVRPTSLEKGGNMKDAKTFDEPSLHIIVRAKVSASEAAKRRKRGGPKDPADEALAISRS